MDAALDDRAQFVDHADDSADGGTRVRVAYCIGAARSLDRGKTFIAFVD